MKRDPITRLPAGVAERLGYYVYLYVDPRDDRPFYVGKGKGERVLAHLDDSRDSDKTRIIAELQEAGVTPRLDILAHGLKNEETALRIEAAAIDLLGLGKLTNEVRGWMSLQMGRMTLDELVGYYEAQPMTISEPSLLIRINQLYRHNMSPLELDEATRGIWKLGQRREQVRFALAVFEGVVREVYEVESWHTAGTEPYKTRDLSERDLRGRWEFTGRLADAGIRGQYRGGSVQHYWGKGAQNPCLYVNA